MDYLRRGLRSLQDHGPVEVMVELELREVIRIAAANVAFKDIDEELRTLHTIKHFPVEKRDHDHDVIGLCYLTLLREDEPERPFTRTEIRVFKQYENKYRVTYLGLRIGLTLAIVLPVVAFISFLSLASDLRLEAQIAIITVVTAAVTTFTGIVGYFTTGFFPDSSSTANDERQDAIAELKERYECMAYRLITLYMEADTRKLAKKIVYDIDLDLLQKQIYKGVRKDSTVATSITGMLVDAVKFIQDNFHYPYNYPLTAYIRSLQNYYNILDFRELQREEEEGDDNDDGDDRLSGSSKSDIKREPKKKRKKSVYTTDTELPNTNTITEEEASEEDLTAHMDNDVEAQRQLVRVDKP